MSVAPWKMTVCGIDELPDHGTVGVTHVLSILDPSWPVPDAFGGYGEHERLELRFDDVIEDADDKSPPTEGHVAALLAFGRDLSAEAGAHLLVHCHAGVSRSTASMILMIAQARPDVAADAIVQEVFAHRQKAWPNLRIIEMGDRMLGRDGALVAAVHGVYREQLRRRPDLAAYFVGGGRGREVAAAEA